MKLIFLAFFLLLIVSSGLEGAEGSRDVILRLKRNDDYYAYPRAIFIKQEGNTIYFEPRRTGKTFGFKRKDVIIDKPPLKDQVKLGVRVLAEVCCNSFGQDRYMPARIMKKVGTNYLVKPVCENKSTQLGFTDGYVYSILPKKAFTASSMYGSDYAPTLARLNEPITWCAAKDDKNKPWLQVDLQENSYICSVTTKSYASSKESITAFTLAVSRDNKVWHHLKENNKEKVFKRDFPAVDLVTHFVNLVDKPYRYIRFHSVSYQKWPCLAVEVNGYRRIRDPPHLLTIDRLRMEGSVCKLQNKCVEKQNAECNEEGKILGTYNCRCKSGFQGRGSRKVFEANEKFFKCLDIDECVDNPCGAFAICTNIPGSYKCTCKKGYNQQVNGNQTVCKDIDECSDSPCSTHARCTNTDGSFTCQCKHGYQGDGYTCKDIDECNLDDGTSKCKNKHSYCTNSPGSYKCTCKAGFTGDGKSCTDINECAVDPNLCKHMNGKCLNNVGSYTCDCLNGYQLEDGKCQEIDECSNPDWNDCNKHAKCTNKPGSYSCKCKKGFTGTGYDKFGCVDIDECSKNTCGTHSVCKNNEGSFTCKCDNGYTSDNGRHCSDIDECKTSKAHCHQHATCKNLPGSFACFCPEGFTGKGDVVDGCTAMSWCEWKGHAKCNKELRHCDNKLKRCTGCKSGYKEKNGLCQDINECEKNPCGKGAGCVNTPGSFKCHCKKGYLFNSKSKKCEDKDECSSPKHRCHVDAVCENTPGSYRCKCKKGFDGDGFYCADTNECYTDDYQCPKNSVCSNTLGSYKCTCKRGYHQAEDECKEDVTSKETDTTKKEAKGTSFIDFLWNSGSTLTSQSVWKLFFLSATLILALV